MTAPSENWSQNSADFDFDFLASAMLDGGWGEKDFWIGFIPSARVWLVAAIHRPSGITIEGALHAGLLTYAATGLVHDMSRKLKAELDEREAK